MLKPQSLVRCLLILVACVIGATVMTTLFVSQITDIDINSGRLREGVEFAGLAVHERIVETHFSLIAEAANRRVRPPDWRRVSEEPFWGLTIRHFKYHGVPTALEQAVLACELHEVSMEDRQRLVQELLRNLSNDDARGVEATVLRFLEEQTEATPWPIER